MLLAFSRACRADHAAGPPVRHEPPFQAYLTHFDISGSFASSLCLCLCLFPGEQGHGQAQADKGPLALPDQQRSCPCLCVFCWIPSRRFSQSFVRTMAASALRRTAKSTPGQHFESELASQLRTHASGVTCEGWHQCSFPSTPNSSNPTAVSQYRSNTSQLHLHWTNQLMDRSNTSKLGTTRLH